MGAVVPVPTETVAAAQALWDQGELTATEIGARVGLTKNGVLGLAHRRGWSAKRPSPKDSVPTTADRLDALNAKFEAAISAANAALDQDRARFRRERADWLEKQKRA